VQFSDTECKVVLALRAASATPYTSTRTQTAIAGHTRSRDHVMGTRFSGDFGPGRGKYSPIPLPIRARIDALGGVSNHWCVNQAL